MNDMNMPPLMTEEEAEAKIAMMKATEQVAEAVDGLKKNLEDRGWNPAEAAHTSTVLFNTLLMTSFNEAYKNKADEQEKKLEGAKERMIQYAVDLMKERGFAQTDGAEDVTRTAVQMLIEGKPEAQAAAVFEDFFGDGTKGVLFAVTMRARDRIKEELNEEEKRRG